MNTGKLRKRLSFQSKGTAKNTMGEQTVWTEYYAAWGSIDVMKGQLMFSTAEFVSQSTYSIGIRYPKGVNIAVSDHIVCEGRTFEIQAILNKEMRNRELQVLAYLVNDVE